ncbi:MAG: hypothetical protein ACFB2W_06120 [Leptolyngbyaceae cyanobacterium]
MSAESSTSSNQSNQTTEAQDTWYVVKQAKGHCDIITQTELGQLEAPQAWGPFSSRSEAIAKRVGLIRSGKCLPQ